MTQAVFPAVEEHRPRASTSAGLVLLRQRLTTRRVAGIVLVLVCFVFLLSPPDVRAPRSIFGASLQDVRNRTLGFEKLYVISLPNRTDRHDILTLSASFTDIDFELADGMEDRDFASRARPAVRPEAKKKLEKGVLGSLRAHLNVLQTIVQNKVQTALILEDDSDWDVTIKDQLSQIARGTAALQAGAQDIFPRSILRTPYGNDWDMLWLGYCSIGTAASPTTFWITEDDPTVAPISKRHGQLRESIVPDDMNTNTTRVTFRNTDGLCTYGYAISNEGARKALTALTVLPRAQAIDHVYQALCGAKYADMPFVCYGTYPPVFGSYRPQGPKSRDSDIFTLPTDVATQWHDPYTFDIVYSVALNVWSLLSKGDNEVQAQWPDLVPEPRRALGEPLKTGKSYLKSVDMRGREKARIQGINNEFEVD